MGGKNALEAPSLLGFFVYAQKNGQSIHGYRKSLEAPSLLGLARMLKKWLRAYTGVKTPDKTQSGR